MYIVTVIGTYFPQLLHAIFLTCGANNLISL